MASWICRTLNWLVIVETILAGMTITAVMSGSSPSFKPFICLIVVIAVGIVPIIASLIAIRSPQKARRILLATLPFALLYCTVNPLYNLCSYPISVAVLFGAVAVPATYWSIISRRHWPVPANISNFSTRLLKCAGFFVIFVVSTLFSFFLPWWSPVGDCGGRPLFNKNGVLRPNVFTAKILYVAPRTPILRSSLWSIARVEQEFSPVSKGPFGLIILRNFFRDTDQGERYFVEGRRSGEALNRFMPIIEAVGCGRTSRIQNATVALRTVAEGRPRSGNRLIGRVYLGASVDSGVPFPKADVDIQGPHPTGTTVHATTDSEGIYQLDGLEPGVYFVTATTGRSTSGSSRSARESVTVQPDEIAELTLVVH